MYVKCLPQPQADRRRSVHVAASCSLGTYNWNSRWPRWVLCMPLHPLPSSWFFHVMGPQQETRCGASLFDFGQLIQFFFLKFLENEDCLCWPKRRGKVKILKRDEFIWDPQTLARCRQVLWRLGIGRISGQGMQRGESSVGVCYNPNK